MQSLAINPALWQLLRFQALGKLRKLKASFSSPRRQMLSILAVLLAFVWLGNAIAGVMLRDAYDPLAFQRWMSRGLLLYFCWHLIHVAYARPEAAVEWTSAEQILLCGGPFSRRELLTYRLLGIFSATLPKASIVALVLWPDLPMVWSGFLGLLLGLVFLEYIRLILQTLAAGMSDRRYLALRIGVFASVIAVVGSGFWHAVSLMELDGKNHWLFLGEWVWAIGTVNDSGFGQLIEAPFRLFASVIIAEAVTAKFLTSLASGVLLVASAAHFSIRLDGVFYQKTREAEFLSTDERTARRTDTGSSRWPRISRVGGAGPIAWRQLSYARRHWGSLSVGLGVPAFLACLPLLVPGDPKATFLTVFGGVVFYSFVLLPAALKLDFRRDFDHLALLKSLPLRPLAVVIGQLTTPVVLTWAFQISLLALAAVVCGVDWDLALGCILFLIPVSIFFTALDNLIFLLYPHRLHQEGLDVFLRTTLTFTGKGLLLVGALFGVLGWLNAARMLTENLGDKDLFRVVFVAGVGTLAGLTAAIAVLISVWVYSRMDPTDL